MGIDRTSPVNSVSSVQARDNAESVGQQSRRVTTKDDTSVTSVETLSTQVNLSGTQPKLMKPASQDVNVQRVEQLKNAIRNGQLTMDPGKIADALLQDIQDYLKG